MNRVVLADNLSYLQTLPSETVDLIYIDPPFHTEKKQKSARDPSVSYEDSFEDYFAFLLPRLHQAHRLLKPKGSLYVHLDYREVHYVKVALDSIFGRDNFVNEVIWSYDYGARSKTRWPTKHDNILFYVKDKANGYTWNYESMDRIPYMAPGLVGPEKAARGKTPTDVWWHTIVPTQGKERTGYPTQKPLGIIRRIVNISSYPGDLVMDFFAGSGTVGAVCKELNRSFLLVDNNPQAFKVMKTRLGLDGIEYENLMTPAEVLV